MMKLRKAVFPAAGLGTRFLPATKAQPKEMLPLVDKPIIQYGVEEAMASGCDQIIIITGRGKQSIEAHFDVSYELEKMLEERKKTVLLADDVIDANPPCLQQMAKVFEEKQCSVLATQVVEGKMISSYGVLDVN